MDPFEKELWAARQALLRLQRKMETLPGWRDSLAWEAVEDASYVLENGLFEAYCYPHMPKDSKHWRDKYVMF